MNQIINSKIKELKQQQINYSNNDNSNLKEEVKKILPIILALLSQKYIRYSSTDFKLQRMAILKEIERQLIDIKKNAIKSQADIINNSLISNFKNNYSSIFNILSIYKNGDISKRNFKDEEINKMIKVKFYNKTLDKRINDNTSLIFNKTYKIINDSLKGDKPLEDIVININKSFDTLEGLGERLINTESTRIFNNAEDEAFADFGINEVMWCADLCQNTCNYCAGQDGEIFSIHDKPEIPAHSNCNCYWEIV